MTTFKTRLQIYGRLLKTHWFIVLCFLGFCFIATLSAQGFDPLFLGLITFFLWIIGPSLIFIVCFAEHYKEKRKTRLKPEDLMAFVMAFSLSFSVVFTNWPLRLNFLISHPALVREAQNLAAKMPSVYPRWVGGFYVQKSAVEHGATCFWTQGDSEEVNRSGIILNPKGGKPPFNLWSDVSLGDNWHAISED